MSIRSVILTCATVALIGAVGAARADSTRVALVPGGPHPYFAAWEQAGKDAVRDFKLAAADYKVPQKWSSPSRTTCSRAC